jgi:hypothetical protein
MKCPRCDQEMVCYVSSPVEGQGTERRLYFACRCGMMAARNEEQGFDEALVADESTSDANKQ